MENILQRVMCEYKGFIRSISKLGKVIGCLMYVMHCIFLKLMWRCGGILFRRGGNTLSGFEL